MKTGCNMHQLKFSTDPNPVKCKTKCIAFLKKERILPSIYLCGNFNNFESKYNGMAQDIKIKRAEYIIKNCELNQEFIEKSVKIAPKQLLNFIVKDMRSVTGKKSEANPLPNQQKKV